MTTTEHTISSYYQTITKCSDAFIKLGYGKELMGVLGSQKEFDKLNLFHYLAFYLFFVNEDIALNVSNGITYTTEEYIEMYKLDCIRKNLACTGCNPDAAMGVWDLSRYNQGSLANAKLTFCGDITELVNYFRCS